MTALMPLRFPLLAGLACCALFAQNEPPLAFEAASVKPESPSTGRGPGPLRGGPGTNSPGQLTGVANLKTLVERAYQMKAYQINAPSWMESARYEIAAKIPAGSTKEQASAMLRTLLADRFHLAGHRETRELPILELVVGKGGPKLNKSDADANTVEPSPGEIIESPKLQKGADGLLELAPGAKLPRSYLVMVAGSDGVRIKLWARREPMSRLADDLSSYLSRPVFDRTGLDGQYDFTLDWAMDTAGGGIPRVGPPPDEIDSHPGPIGVGDSTNIFAAVQSQLGLKLEQKKGPVEVLVIDRADKIPSGN